MCPSGDLQLTLRYEPSSDSMRLVCDVLDDGGYWRRVTDEHLPASSVTSRVRSLCALAVAVGREEAAERSTDAT